MPYVDYREWYRREQERRQQAGLGPVGSPNTTLPQYQSPQFNSGQMLGQASTIGSAALTGASVGGPIGAAIGGAAGAAMEAPGAWRTSSQAQKQGDALGSLRGLGVFAVSHPARMAALLGSVLRREPQTQVEEKRWKKLQQAGFDIPEWVKKGEDIKDPNAHYRSDLAADHIGQTDQGWNNNLFAKSRNEADLRPEDIWGYADNTESFGKNWMGSSEDARRQVMQLALDNKLVDEHHGTVDINWTPELLQQAQTVLGDAVAQKPENKGRRMWVPPSNPWRPPTG